MAAISVRTHAERFCARCGSRNPSWANRCIEPRCESTTFEHIDRVVVYRGKELLPIGWTTDSFFQRAKTLIERRPPV